MTGLISCVFKSLSSDQPAYCLRGLTKENKYSDERSWTLSTLESRWLSSIRWKKINEYGGLNTAWWPITVCTIGYRSSSRVQTATSHLNSPQPIRQFLADILMFCAQCEILRLNLGGGLNDVLNNLHRRHVGGCTSLHAAYSSFFRGGVIFVKLFVCSINYKRR